MKRWSFCFLAGLCFVLWLWTCSAEHTAHWTPDMPAEDLLPVLREEELSDADYARIYRQTGLGRSAAEQLIEMGREDVILTVQQAFYTVPTIVCEKNSPISREEHTVTDGKKTAACPIVSAQDGDILITPNSHVFGWRNGHAALVVDARNRITLESAVLGEVSGFQSIDKWESYPAFMVLRVRGLSTEQRALAAEYAAEELMGIPYGFTVGILSPKDPQGVLRETHCAHLVRAAYMHMGIDLDSDGGRIVTPRQLAASPMLEVVQIYGMDPTELWK